MIRYNNYGTPIKKQYSMGEVARMLNIKGLGKNKLYKFLREKGILSPENQAYLEYVNQGYFINERSVHHDGIVGLKATATPKGIDFIKELLS